MTKEQKIHDISLLAAQIYIRENLSAYKIENGFEILVDELMEKYNSATTQLENSTKNNWIY